MSEWPCWAAAVMAILNGGAVCLGMSAANSLGVYVLTSASDPRLHALSNARPSMRVDMMAISILF